MARYSKRRNIPTFLVVIIVIVAVVTLVSVVRALFFGGDKKPTEVVQVESNRDTLLSLAIDHQVRLTVRGPIVADENFNSYRITITPRTRSLVTYQGYLDKQIERKDYSNNTPAYEEFVNALDKANFTAGQPLSGEADNTKGVCATGLVYEYEIVTDDGVKMRLWTSTCKGSKGSLKASVQQLNNLFTAQIPDAREMLRNLNV